ncbi:MAG: response regulator [Candidatus Eremiobacteraeota bacterium]|nr:response regulator [Candidatus Eremiobacteraeota bacterium]
MEERILIIDDDRLMRTSLKRELEAHGFSVAVADDGRMAIEMAGNERFDLIICDVRMPAINGIDTISAIKEVQPVARSIMITAYASNDAPISALKLKVDDYLMKPFSIDELLRSIRTALLRAGQQQERRSLTRSRRNFLKLVRGVLFESRISHLIGHSDHVARLSLAMAGRLGFPPERMQNLYLAALLHNVGYVELPPRMLEKGEFAEHDRELVRNHPQLARELLRPFEELKEIATVIACHHERWDGSGYPRGLREEQIPLEARIIAVCEAFSSLVSERPHRKRKSGADALRIIEKEQGKSFEPRLVKLLASMTELEVGGESDMPMAFNERDDHRALTLLNLARVYGDMGDYAVAESAYAELLALIAQGESQELSIEALMGRASMLQRSGRHREALELACEAQRIAREQSLEFLRARALLLAAYSRIRLSSLEGIEDDLQAALEVFRIWESSYHQSEAELLLCSCLVSAGKAEGPEYLSLLRGLMETMARERFYDILTRHEELSTMVIRHALKGSLLVDEIGALFKDSQGALMALLESLAGEKEITLKLKVISILKDLKDVRARALLVKAQADSDRLVADSASRVLSSIGAAESTGDIVPLQVFFFGKFRVMAGSTLIGDEAWTTRKAKSLFAYLASRRSDGEREDRLVDMFWCDFGERGRHALHNTISLIRRILAPMLGTAAKKLLVNQKGRYMLNRKMPVWTDLDEFERHFSRGRYCFERREWEEGLPELQKAERLVTGEFMEGTYDEWSDDIRLLTRNSYLDLLSVLARYFAGKNKHEVSIEYWKKILAFDNCFEEAYGGLMESFGALGNKNEAVKLFHRCEAILKKELNLAPPPAVVEAYLKLSR